MKEVTKKKKMTRVIVICISGYVLSFCASINFEIQLEEFFFFFFFFEKKIQLKIELQ